MTPVLLRSPDEEVRRAGVAALRAGEEELALLVEAMGDESWRVRKEAVLRAAAWGERDRAAAVLVETLAEPENVGRRNAAVEALARIGGPAVVSLVAALPERLPHRKLIVDTLGLIGDRRAATPLVPWLEDDDANVRAAVAESLGRIGGPEAEVALEGALDRGELLLSLACLEALNSLGARLLRSRVEPLASSPVLRPAVLVALGYSGDPEAAPLLARHVGDRSRAVREAATLALDRLQASLDDDGRIAVARALSGLDDQAQQLLTQALLEGQPATRRAAASVLGLCGVASAVRPLVLALTDPEVEEPAALALISLGAEAIGPLAAMAGEVDSSLRLAIFRLVPSLRVLSDARLHAALEAAFADEDAEVAAEAVRALGRVGGAGAVGSALHALDREEIALAAEEALIALSTRFPDEVRAAVLGQGFAGTQARHLCRVLGECGRADDAPVLEALLKGEAPPLRAAAAEALATLAGARAFDHLQSALLDPSPEVRAAAARAVSGLPNGRAALAEREPTEHDPLVRAVIAAALARSV